MRSRKQAEQTAAGSALATEGPNSAATARGRAAGPTGCPMATRARPEPDRGVPPRLHSPDRHQLLSSMTIDELLEADHPARAVWSYVEGLDLTFLYDRIRARRGVAGRPPIDPRLLVALWLYATLSGFSSARELADLCIRHDAFRWLAGGVSVNYHTLADFHTDHLEFLGGLLEQSVERLRRQGLIDLGRIAQDGMRVRASAGAASFRRRATLERLLQEARAEVQRVRQKLAATESGPEAPRGAASEPATADEPPPPRQAAAIRHAEGRLERIEQALGRMPEMEAKIQPTDDKEARVSTTDPEATVMKMADGGYRPAYNLEYGTACGGQVIVGVDVVTRGSDQGQLPPMLDRIEERFGERPKEALVDGGLADHKDIEEVQGGEKKCTVYAPVAKPKKEGVDRHEPKATDSEEVAEWRQRMGTPEAKAIYKERAATAECVNAQARNRGLQRLTVRGTAKVKAIATWFAIVHNMARSFALQPQPG